MVLLSVSLAHPTSLLWAISAVIPILHNSSTCSKFSQPNSCENIAYLPQVQVDAKGGFQLNGEGPAIYSKERREEVSRRESHCRADGIENLSSGDWL